jgi:hypothetical protein
LVLKNALANYEEQSHTGVVAGVPRRWWTGEKYSCLVNVFIEDALTLTFWFCSMRLRGFIFVQKIGFDILLIWKQ